jgi:hypothetical protein
MRAVLLTGGLASGKTTIATECGRLLDERATRNAVIDLDWLCWVGPDVTGDALTAILRNNLAAVAATYADVGVRHLVLARALTEVAHLVAIQDALPGTDLVVVRLVVDDATARSRLAARGDDADLEAATAVARAVECRGVQDADVDNGGSRPPTEVALEVLARAGWR